MNYPGCVLTTLNDINVSVVEQELLRHPQIAGIVLFSKNYDNPTQLKSLISELKAIRENLLVMVDHEGGRVQRFLSGFTALPSASIYGRHYDNYGLVATRELIIRDQGKAARELGSVGIDINLMPLLDLDIGHNDVVRDRCFHSSADLVSALAAVYINTMHEHGLLVTGKHFPGHGWVSADSHHALPYDARTLDDIFTSDLLPFINHLSSLDLLMPAHIVFSEIDPLPVPFSHRWLKDILRQQMGYRGVIVTDDLSMQACQEIASTSDCALAAHDAGCDLLMICHQESAVIEVVEKLERQCVRSASDAMFELTRKIRSKSCFVGTDFV